MKIAAREMNLLFATLAVVLLALTYLALEPKLQEWADFGEQREDLQARRAKAQQLFGDKGVMDLIGINGYYSLLSMVMNAARTTVPASTQAPLPPL